MNIYRVLCIPTVVALCFAGPAEQPQPSDSIVEVHVTVLTGDGKPFPKAFVGGATTLGMWSMETDANGQCIVKLRVKDVAERVFVQLQAGSGAHLREPRISETELLKERQTFADTFFAWAWPKAVEAVAEVSSDKPMVESATIRGVPGVPVHGRLLTTDGSPCVANIYNRRLAGHTSSSKDEGLFDALRAERGVAGEVELEYDRALHQWVTWPDISAVETVDLGDIRTKKGSPRGLVRGQIENAVGGDWRIEMFCPPGAFLLSVDGSYGVSISVQSAEPSTNPPSDATATPPRPMRSKLAQVPVGEYFVTPGESPGNCQRMIRDAIAKGEDVEQKWGLMRIVVAEGKEVTFALDGERIYKAVTGEALPRFDLSKSAIVKDLKQLPKKPVK